MATRRRSEGWEAAALRALSYPANLALGGVVAFLVALPVITALPAAVALTRAFAAWHDDGDDAVVTNTLRELRATWRRTWRAGIALGTVLLLLVIDLLFLVSRIGTASGGLAVVLAGATAPVACLAGIAFLLVPVAATRDPDGSMRRWAGGAVILALRSPLRTVVVLALAVAVLATCAVLPTLAPFVALSVPLYLAVRTWPVTDTAVARDSDE